MVRILDHRGPDDVGVFVDGALGLAHRRLSIIDIAGGHQPMISADGSLSITFNGEIFNFVELRDDLKQKGHTFLTRSDTEVILGLYQQYGTDCVRYMNGQWSFAIWDARRKRLFISRDRLGVRPLFYATTGRAFVFGSEIKALLAHPQLNAEIDLQALSQVFQFWFAIPPKSIFNNIQQLPPAHSLVIEDGEVKVERYWQLDFSNCDEGTLDSPGQEQRYVDELCHLLLDSTRLRLRADVPVGAYLSGGLDSSITTALAQQYMGPSLRTFSIAFEEPELDESEYQLQLVRALGTQHEMIRCTASDIAEVFPEMMWHVETPVLRTAPAPMFLLSRLVRERGFKVVLTGEGADEFWGGYDIFKEAKVRAFWAKQIGSKRRPLLLKRLYPYLEGIQRQSPAYLQAFFCVGGDMLSDPLSSHMPRWELTRKAQLFCSQAVRSELNGANPYSAVHAVVPDEFAQWETFSRAQYLEACFLLPDYLLSSQGDRVAMANSVEGRYPFLDYRLVEFSTRVPARLKMKVLNEKYLLKRAFGHLVPEAITTRHKQPYRAPDAASFVDPQTGKPRTDYIAELLSPECIRQYGIFDVPSVQKLIDKAKSGRAVSFLDNAAVVGVLSTQALIDQFVINFEERLTNARHPTRLTPVCN
jgi:asparagine synthase (glutamine-hydrolysing)